MTTSSIKKYLKYLKNHCRLEDYIGTIAIDNTHLVYLLAASEHVLGSEPEVSQGRVSPDL